jgi:hypothetical protein
MELERAAEQEYRPHMLQASQEKVEEEAKSRQGQVPQCMHCGRALRDGRHAACRELVGFPRF